MHKRYSPDYTIVCVHVRCVWMCVCANSGLDTLSDWCQHVEENHMVLFWQGLDLLTGLKYVEAPRTFLMSSLLFLFFTFSSTISPLLWPDRLSRHRSSLSCSIRKCRKSLQWCPHTWETNKASPRLSREKRLGWLQYYQNVCTSQSIDTLDMDIDTFRLIWRIHRCHEQRGSPQT